MRLTSRRDMISGGAIACAGLMFQLGATFGPPPPPGYLRGPEVGAIRAAPYSSQAPSPVVAASFLDQPAPIGAVMIGADDAKARIDLRLGPGRVDPTVSWSRGDGGSVLRIEGLGVDRPALGTGGGETGDGLVGGWSVDPADAAVFSLKAPARIDRVFLDDMRGPDRRLVLELTACPVTRPPWEARPPPKSSADADAHRHLDV